MTGQQHPQRSTAYGEDRPPTILDRFGKWLGTRAVCRNAGFDDARFGDFGCGYNAAFARTQLGVARSALLVDLALADDLKQHPKVNALEGSLDDVLPSIPDRSLDVVVCLSVLEHLWDPQGTLHHFHRILAPGGVAVLNVPAWSVKPLLEFAAFRAGLTSTVEIDDHKSYYDPRDLWPMLVRAGFQPSLIRCHRHKFGLNTAAVCRVPAPGDARG